jgi:hypothetical protein
METSKVKEEWGVPQGKGYRISITLWTTFIGTEAEALEKAQDDADEFENDGGWYSSNYVATCDGIEEIEISYPRENSNG